MESTPLLTMVIPVRNRAAIVGQLLERVAGEMAAACFNLIVVDNGSTDDTLGVVKRMLAGLPPDRVMILSESRPGASAARNRGLAAVVTPYVMFFDSDDLFAPGHVGRILARLEASVTPPQILRWDVAARRPDESGDDSATVVRTHPLSPTPAHLTLKKQIFHSSLATQRYCVETALIRRVGGWNEKLPVWNDLELGVRLLLADPSDAVIPGPPMVEVIPRAESITGVRWADRWRERADSLDAIDRAIRDAYPRDENSASRLAFAVDARRVMLAARIHAEGEPEAAASLRAEAASRHRTPRRMLLRLIYAVQRHLGKGGAAIASVFS